MLRLRANWAQGTSPKGQRITREVIEIQATACDLFNTLVRIDPKRYPSVVWEGEGRLSSARILLDLILPWCPGLAPERFVRASIEVQDELEVERREHHREIPSRERFRRTLSRAGVDPQTDNGRLLQAVHKLHADTLIAATRLDPYALPVLAELASRMPVVLVSNFDDGTVCRRLLRERGILPYLSAVLISEEVGWRKPHREIFERAARASGCRPEQMLFVGDSPIDDVDGARAVGMRPIWIPGPVDPPPDWREPELRISRLEELLALDCFQGV